MMAIDGLFFEVVFYFESRIVLELSYKNSKVSDMTASAKNCDGGLFEL